MTAPVLPIRKSRTERVERVETRAEVPSEILDLIADLNTRLLREIAAREALERDVARMKPIVDAVVDHARKIA